MKTVGLIVEYNPLHYGHMHHYAESRKTAGAEAVIAVMSGHFLQRGEPALIGKWARAEAALRMGADLVIELPVRYSTSPAEWFAYGAVSLLNATGTVDSLCFGSELGELQPLSAMAAALHKEPEAFQAELKAELKTGKSFPSAYGIAAQRLMAAAEQEEPFAAAMPNNNLGLHYLMALHRTQSRITPYTVPRVKAGYHQTEITDRQIASATAIRRILFERGDLSEASAYLPDYTYRILEREIREGRGPVSWESHAAQLLYQLISTPPVRLSGYDEVDEGLEHRIHRALSGFKSKPFSVDSLLDALKTKRYTRTKLQRTLLRILLKQPKESFRRDELAKGPAYLRVLGFSETGRELLKRMKRTASLPIITAVDRGNAGLLEEDIRATAVYAMGFNNSDLWQLQRDYYQAPVQLD